MSKGILNYIKERVELEIGLLGQLRKNLTNKKWWEFKLWNIGVDMVVEWGKIKYNHDPFIVLKWIAWGFMAFCFVSNPAGVRTEFWDTIPHGSIGWVIAAWFVARSTFAAPLIWRIKERWFSYYTSPAIRHGKINFRSMLANLILRGLNAMVLVLTIQIAAQGMHEQMGVIVNRVLNQLWWIETISFGLYIGIVIWHWGVDCAETITEKIEKIGEKLERVPDFVWKTIFMLEGIAWLIVIGQSIRTIQEVLIYAISMGLLAILIAAAAIFIEDIKTHWEYVGKWAKPILWATPTLNAILFIVMVSYQWHQVSNVSATAPATQPPSIEAPAAETVPSEAPVASEVPATIVPPVTFTSTPAPTSTAVPPVTFTSTPVFILNNVEWVDQNPSADWTDFEGGYQAVAIEQGGSWFIVTNSATKTVAGDSYTAMSPATRIGAFAGCHLLPASGVSLKWETCYVFHIDKAWFTTSSLINEWLFNETAELEDGTLAYRVP